VGTGNCNFPFANRKLQILARPVGWVSDPTRRCLIALVSFLLIAPPLAQAQDAPAPTQDEPTEPAEETKPQAKIPFDTQAYKVKVLLSFAYDARLTPRLRSDVLRRFNSHAAAFVGDLWKMEIQDVSGTLALSSEESIGSLTVDRIDPFIGDADKVFVLGVRSSGDRILLASREFDVVFERWGPVFQGSARESTQVARELVIISARMFSPLARLEAGDAKRASVVIKGGRLPTINPDAIDPQSKYRPSFQFIPNGTLFRPMRPVFNEDRTEIIGMTPMSWTFYVVESREGPFATCEIDSALKNVMPPPSEDPDEPQLIVARTAGGNTRLRLVDPVNKAALPAIDVEKVETRGAASIRLGTTDSDGSILIPPNKDGIGLRVWVYVRHGRDMMAKVPILPGAGDEPDLPLNPDTVRLNIEGRVMAMQTQIVDQVARRTILAGNFNQLTKVYEGGLIRKAITKKDWIQAQSLIKQLKASPNGEVLMTKLEAAKTYARSERPEEKWTGKIKRLFGETEEIITLYFNADEFADIVEELEDDLKIAMEEAAAENPDGQPQATPAAGSATPSANTAKSGP
jgi:hypothetical protein